LFQRAVEAVGTDFQSGMLWEKYIEFETLQDGPVNALYRTVLALPTEYLARFHEQWKKLSGTKTVEELLTEEEAKEWAEDDDVERRAKLNKTIDDLYQHASSMLDKRLSFELVLKQRPYFHIKPLPAQQLSIWKDYLKFEEEEGDHDRVVKLYERCIVACCNYWEYWKNYIHYLESKNDEAAAREVFIRATTIFLKRRPKVHVAYALFEEKYGNIESARDAYNNIRDKQPANLEVVIKSANFERRQGNLEAAEQIFRTGIEECKEPILCMYLARFLDTFTKDVDKARTVYREAVSNYPDNKNIWLAAINFETSKCVETGTDPIVELYEQALGTESKLPEEAKKELWSNYVEFADNYLSDFSQVADLNAKYVKLYPQAKKETRKRLREGDTSGTFRQPPQKMSRMNHGGYPQMGMAHLPQTQHPFANPAATFGFGQANYFPQATPAYPAPAMAWPQQQYYGYSAPYASQ